MTWSASRRVLDAELVVLHPDDVHAAEVERVELGVVLTGRVVPEHDPLRGESALEGVLDGGQVSHPTPPSPAIFFRAAPNFG